MRKSFTLIELLFSMIIIALVFTLFPKIIQLSSKSSKYTLKEEAMYNGLALMGLIKNLPWDEKNNQINDILIAQNGLVEYDCNFSFAGSEKIYRRGSFVGSRNCIHKEWASAIGLEEASIDQADDMDDFDGYEMEAVNKGGSRVYKLGVSAYCIIDINTSSTTKFPDDPDRNESTTNLKYIKIGITPLSNRTKSLGEGFGSFWYFSSNIGQLMVNSQPWSGQ